MAGPNPSRLSNRQWPYRCTLIVIGLMTALIGYEGVSQGYWWVPVFDERYGRLKVAPMLGWLFVGFVLVALGLVPWPKLSVKDEPRKRDKWRTHV